MFICSVQAILLFKFCSFCSFFLIHRHLSKHVHFTFYRFQWSTICPILFLGWKDLWENNTYPWHKDEIHPNLIKNLQTLIEATGKTDNKDIRFFVPLCGKTKDLLFLKSQGFQVIGCEGVEKAVVDFFNENSLEFSKTDLSADGTTSFTSKDGKLNIVKGDYFKLTPELLGGKIDCVWDRGSLVAIDVAMRPK